MIRIRANNGTLVEKDECCVCPCHEQLAMGADGCPYCYYIDGIAHVQERCTEHEKLLAAKI